MARRVPATPLIVANWKMQLGIEESHQRLSELKQSLKTVRGRYQAVVCPSFVALDGLKKVLRGSSMKLGAQDVFWNDHGAYTGEVSPLNLREVGVEYVIIGHSERRQLLGETDEMVGRKIISALGHGLTPILCVGETAHERNEGRHELVIAKQLTAALRTAPPPMGHSRLYVAYEPIWAIGTGEPAGAEVAQTMREVIRQTLIELYSPAQVEQSFRILYGGSVNADNVMDYVRANSFHGVLAGTASLDPAKFAWLISHITKEFNKYL